MSTTYPNTSQLAAARKAAGLSLSEAAELFGITYTAWQKREVNGSSATKTTIGEYNYLLVLANQHPEYLAIKRLPKDALNPLQEFANASLDLSRYLAAGCDHELVLPTVVEAMMNILNTKANEFYSDWKKEILPEES